MNFEDAYQNYLNGPYVFMRGVDRRSNMIKSDDFMVLFVWYCFVTRANNGSC